MKARAMMPRMPATDLSSYGKHSIFLEPIFEKQKIKHTTKLAQS